MENRVEEATAGDIMVRFDFPAPYSSIISLVSSNCYFKPTCSHILFYLDMHANKAKKSTRRKNEPAASFVCQTADNCNNNHFDVHGFFKHIFFMLFFLSRPGNVWG